MVVIGLLSVYRLTVSGVLVYNEMLRSSKGLRGCGKLLGLAFDKRPLLFFVIQNSVSVVRSFSTFYF